VKLNDEITLDKIGVEGIPTTPQVLPGISYNGEKQAKGGESTIVLDEYGG